MNQKKLLSFLSVMGLVFLIFVGINYVEMLKTRGDVIKNPVVVSDIFSSQFRRVITKGRFEPMTDVSFLTPDGTEIGWSDLKGRYVLVNFWASWCGACVVELPSLGKLQKRFAGKGLEVIAISLDAVRSHADIKEFLHNRDIGEFAAYLDGNKGIKKKISMRGLPTTYLLDSKGNIRYIFEGDADWAAFDSIEFFTALLKRE